jgi:hypothetical protein
MRKGVFERIEPIWRQLIEGYGMQLRIESAASQARRLGIPLS